MTTIEHTDNDLPDNLPLLTQVVKEVAPDDLPTLTEVVAGPDTQKPARWIEPGNTYHCSTLFGDGYRYTPPTLLVAQESMADTTEAATGSHPAVSQENSAGDIAMADDDLPGLVEPVEVETPPGDNETWEISNTPKTAIPPPHIFNDEEMQHLLRQLEAHIDTVLREKLSLDTVFTKKLTLQLEQLQQLAITQAIDELKAELPEILRNALNARTGL